MLVADVAGFINNQERRDTAQFEYVPLLPIQVCHFVLGVGQADVGQVVLAPVAAIGVGAVGPDGKDFRVTRGEGRIIIAQAREMGAAVRSHKSAQENQDNVLAALVIREFYGAAFKVG